jgi:hypothetical protein
LAVFGIVYFVAVLFAFCVLGTYGSFGWR